MKMQKIEFYVPAGIDGAREKFGFFVGLAAAAGYSVLVFAARLGMAYRALFEVAGNEKILRQDAVMNDFSWVANGSLRGFAVFAICMAIMMIYHYVYHYQGSKSIYLMRRLPSRWEMWRRCLTLPLTFVVLAAAAVIVLLLLYYGVYILVTPDGCLSPGQWQKFWNS